MNSIKFFVGTDVNGGCAECQLVFEYSLKKHCSVPYEIVWMKISDDPKSFWHGWNTTTWSTPFSGFRYGIAEYCNFEGRAIYCDDDQMWLDDPVKLFNTEINSFDVMTGKKLSNGEIRHCVSVIDNEKFGAWIQPDWSIHERKDHPLFTEFMKQQTFPKTTIIDDRWNCYDGENMDIKDIGLLHFTDMSTNPGVAMAVERLGNQALHWYDGPILDHRRPACVWLFQQYYMEALADGFRITDYLPNRRMMYEKQSQKHYASNNGWDVRKGQ